MGTGTQPSPTVALAQELDLARIRRDDAREIRRVREREANLAREAERIAQIAYDKAASALKDVL